MKLTPYSKGILVLLLLLIITVISACTCHEEDPRPLPYNYMNVPEGETAIVENMNITGMGARKNNPNTTWIIKGQVVMDALEVMGHVIVEKDACLTVVKKLHVKHEGILTVKNELKYAELRHEGTLHYYNHNK